MSETHEDCIHTMPVWKKWLIRIVFWGTIIAAVIFFPGIVAGVVAGVAIFALIIYLWVKRKIKKFLAPLANLDLFPMEVKLTVQDKVKLHHEQDVELHRQTLTGLGFEEIGVFEASNLLETNILAFVDTQKSIYAVVYDMAIVKPVLDYFIPFVDETSVTFTNNTMPQMFDRPPGKPIERYPDHDVESLYQTCCERCPSQSRRDVSRDDFVPTIEKYYAEEKAWQRDHWDNNEKLEQSLKEAFLEESQWSAIEWDRKQEQVLFIHSLMLPLEVTSQYMEVASEYIDGVEYSETEVDPFITERNRAHTLAKEMSPLAAFTAMVETSGVFDKFEKIMELHQPVRTDVYLVPEVPDDGEDDSWDEE